MSLPTLSGSNPLTESQDVVTSPTAAGAQSNVSQGPQHATALPSRPENRRGETESSDISLPVGHKKAEDQASSTSRTPVSSRRQSEESAGQLSTHSQEVEDPLRITRYMTSDIPPPDLRRLSSQVSRSSSYIGPSVKVPRLERRGLLARFCLVAEVIDPQSYPNRTKWLLTMIVAIAASAAPMGSAIIIPTLNDISADFGVSQTVTNLAVALYMLSMSIFPLWWSSFSEKFGRRSIYLISFVLFTIFAVLSAISKNITMFVVMRALSGGAAASVQAVGAGSISDMWEPRYRGRALSIFYLGPLCGPLIAPIMGGAMTQNLGWRSTQWFLTGFGGLLTIMIIFALPETLRRKRPTRTSNRQAAADQSNLAEKSDLDADVDSARFKEMGDIESQMCSPTISKPDRALSTEKTGDNIVPLDKTKTNTSQIDESGLQRISTRQSIHDKARETASFVSQYLFGPLKIILLLQYPPVLITVMYASVSFGTLYFLNISVVNTFSRAPYNWSTIIVGLAYIPSSLGFILASILGGPWLDYVMRRQAERAGRYDQKGRLIFLPEDRMQENIWLAASLFPAALLAYGWTSQNGVFWVVPLICNFFFGFGAMLVFGTTTTMLTEFMPAAPSHGVALNNFVRNIFSCLGTLLAYPIIKAIGNGKLMTILASIALALGYFTILMMKLNNVRWREKYGAKLGGQGRG